MANNSITNIKDYFSRHKGLQRINRYSISFENVPIEPQPGGLLEEDFQALNVTIGARALDAVADNLSGFGAGRAVPRSQKFIGGVFLAFPLTNDLHIMKMFDSWFNKIYAGYRQGRNFTVDYYDTVIRNCNMNVKILDPNGNTNMTITFYEVYPLETQPLEFTMLENNKYSIYQVLMNYRDFKYT
jgi:hypothetical protein